MNKKGKPSIEKQQQLVENELRQVISLSAKSSFDVFTVVNTFLKVSINLAYQMSSHHQTVDDLIADKIIDAKVDHLEHNDESETRH